MRNVNVKAAAAVLVIGLVVGVTYALGSNSSVTGSEVVEQGQVIVDNGTHNIYALCGEGYSEANINSSNMDSQWVVDNCWYEPVEKSNQNNEGDA